MEFSQIAIPVFIAGIFGVLVRFLKQPLVVGYILAGIFLSYFGIANDVSALNSFGQIGVTLLLFLLGLEMNLRELPNLGKISFITGSSQVIITSFLGYAVLRLMGFTALPSLYVGIALSFSSTIIMIKLLSEKKDLSSLYGKIAIGSLLFQDFIAISILVFLSSLTTHGSYFVTMVVVLSKIIGLLVLVYFLSRKVLPVVFEKLAENSSELLFIVSISWALGFSYFVAGPLSLSLEVGGFLAGLAMSSIPEHLQIVSRTRPLRDFFITIFFLYLGSKFALSRDILKLLPSSILLSIFVLIANPLIMASILGFMGYKRRTSFMAGLTVGQISEFSLILVALGERLGHVSEEHVSLVVLVGVITMTLSTYLIMGSDKIFEKLKAFLGFLERRKVKEINLSNEKAPEHHIVLVGCDRTGRQLVNYFKRKHLRFMVADINPKVVTNLTAENVNAIYGDISDTDVLDSLNIEKADIVISTTNSRNDNSTLLEYIRNLDKRPFTIFTSASKTEALYLYEKGASLVLVPEVVTGEHIKHLLKTYGEDKEKFEKIGSSLYRKLTST